MQNYQNLEILDAIIERGSFQSAAAALHLTQSAVSQRVRNLEEEIGARVLIRSQPPRPTPLGYKLLSHARRVKLLEQDLAITLKTSDSESFTPVTLGVNGDSLATWFFSAVSPVLKKSKILLELIIENEDITFSRLQHGEVLSCISSRSKRLPGCEVERLGVLPYLCASTPEFAKKYFPSGINREAAEKAPAVIYDQHDYMHYDFFKKNLKLKDIHFPVHRIANSLGFLDSIRYGLAYGMAPLIQAKSDFKVGDLINLTPDEIWKQPLYWHYQRKGDKDLQTVSRKMAENARKLLK
jgi:LysR family transcriptional regulator (chromosome initiation inhibitor)